MDYAICRYAFLSIAMTSSCPITSDFAQFVSLCDLMAVNLVSVVMGCLVEVIPYTDAKSDAFLLTGDYS